MEIISKDPESISASVSVPESDVEKCQICLGEMTAVCILPCGHKFCSECVFKYIKSNVLDGSVSIYCAHVQLNKSDRKIDKCEEKLSDELITSLISHDAELSTKYLKFKFKHDHPTGRECSVCGYLQLCDPIKPEIQCDGCKLEYCYFHNTAHAPGQSNCIEYRISIENGEDYKSSVEYIESLAKPCPGCGMRVMKSGGCNHMKVSKS